MKLADIFGIDIELPKAGQPEDKQTPPEDKQTEPENEENINNSDNSDNSNNSEFLTKTEFSDMLKKELAEFFKDFQAANRSKDQGNGEPAKSFDDVLREIYEQ